MVLLVSVNKLLVHTLKSKYLHLHINVYFIHIFIPYWHRELLFITGDGIPMEKALKASLPFH